MNKAIIVVTTKSGEKYTTEHINIDTKIGGAEFQNIEDTKNYNIPFAEIGNVYTRLEDNEE